MRYDDDAHASPALAAAGPPARTGENPASRSDPRSSVHQCRRSDDGDVVSAWLLVDRLNSLSRRPVVRTVLGGAGGGSAELTPFGVEVIRRYRTMEASSRRAIARDVTWLERNLRIAGSDLDSCICLRKRRQCELTDAKIKI
jgi:molybdate transport repressor ModE-like protein